MGILEETLHVLWDMERLLLPCIRKKLPVAGSVGVRNHPIEHDSDASIGYPVNMEHPR